MDNSECIHGSYLAMDNAPIHKRADIQEMIKKRGYKCMYLLPYSPELNPLNNSGRLSRVNSRDMKLSKKKQYKIVLGKLVSKYLKAIFVVLLSILTHV